MATTEPIRDIEELRDFIGYYADKTDFNMERNYVLILTAREEEAHEMTEAFLKQEGIRYNDIKFQMPMGERILLNDSKPSGLKMSYSVECKRNEGLTGLSVEIDESL